MIEIIIEPPVSGLHYRHFQGGSDYAQIAAVLSASEAAADIEYVLPEGDQFT